MAEKEPALDKALERLEAIADKLEDPSLDLDEAVRLYEEGMRLYADCAKRLDAADLRITQIERWDARRCDDFVASVTIA
ncbi:MAG: exodeoxyribonuclease VII small subunit [Chloroflexi bacterium]|nr:MAG: exodeoxyribonuclease VII small subunit [Chloroflexota bacterium]